jgi:isopenicillin N synthase-like dioxygenase
MNRPGRHLAAMLALSLGLPADYFAAPLSQPLTYSQLLFYPSEPSDYGQNRLGAGAHVDWECSPSCCRTTPQPGSFVIILGEMILRLTDGLYRSAKHRVSKNTSGCSRYSMPTFFDPANDYHVACVPTCHPRDGEPRYPPRSVAQHMQEMARRTLSEENRPSDSRVPLPTS